MSDKTRNVGDKRNIPSDVPFLAPTTRGGGEYTWSLGGGRSITRLASGHVSLLQGGVETAVLDVEDASRLGERVYADARDEAEQLWGRALSSAAAIPLTIKD